MPTAGQLPWRYHRIFPGLLGIRAHLSADIKPLQLLKGSNRRSCSGGIAAIGMAGENLQCVQDCLDPLDISPRKNTWFQHAARSSRSSDDNGGIGLDVVKKLFNAGGLSMYMQPWVVLFPNGFRLSVPWMP